MSEISEIEIISMTKEQNYMRGYADGKSDVLDKIRAEIEQAADKQFQIAMGIADLNERYTHIQMENAYRHSLNIIDKYRGEVDCRECKAEYECYECKKYTESEES